MSIHSASERKATILNAAATVFFEKGFEAATTAEIARRAKTSKRALYELFQSKEGMLAALIRSSTSQMQAPLDLRAPADQPALLALFQAFGSRFLGELLHPDRTAMYRLAIGEAQRSRQVAHELEQGGRKPIVDAMVAMLADAATRGIVRGGDIELILQTFFGVLIGPSQMRLLLGVEEPPTAAVVATRVATAVEAVRRIIATPG